MLDLLYIGKVSLPLYPSTGHFLSPLVLFRLGPDPPEGKDFVCPSYHSGLIILCYFNLSLTSPGPVPLQSPRPPQLLPRPPQLLPPPPLTPAAPRPPATLRNSRTSTGDDRPVSQWPGFLGRLSPTDCHLGGYIG